MNRTDNVVVSLAIACGVACLAGCGEAGRPRAAVHGRVTIADQPLAAGQILFVPIAPNSGPAAAGVIVNGEYKIGAGEGPIVGQNRVEVRGDRPLGFPIDDEQAFAQRGGTPLPPDPVPASFNTQSQLSFEVKAGEDNTYDVPIPAQAQVAGQTEY